MQGLIHKIIYALIAGFSEFLPVSAPAHQLLYQYMTNQQLEALLLLAVHLGCLAACVVCCRKHIKRLRKERKIAAGLRRTRGRQPDPIVLMDTSILRTATIPLVLGFLFYKIAADWINSVAALALTLLINGIVLFVPRLIGRANKDARSLSRMDGLLIGVGGMFGALPGFSRIGCTYSVGVFRGADRNYVVETAFMLSIPALAVMIGFDIYAIAVVGITLTAMVLLSYLLTAALAFGSGYLAIALLRYFSGKTDIVNFAYYSWGLAFFSFLIYLIIH